MNQIAILGDTHFGYRADSLSYQTYIKSFYTDVFIPYLLENNIKEVIQSGDFFDNRKSMSVSAMYTVREVLLDPLREHGINLSIISGNHDIQFSDRSDICSIVAFIREEEYPNVTVYNEITEVGNIAFVPWINKANHDEFTKWLALSSVNIVIGHFEFAGFDFAKGIENKHGLSKKDFKDFDLVLSGHFHTRSNQDNVTYVGTPYEMTWSDYSDQKGFHILDTETYNLEYIKNPNKLYHKIYYDDTTIDYNTFDLGQYPNTYIKLSIINREDDKMWERFIASLYKCGPTDVNISETSIEYSDIDMDDVDIEDTMTILKRHVEAVEDVNHDRIMKHISEINIEAMEESVV